MLRVLTLLKNIASKPLDSIISIPIIIYDYLPWSLFEVFKYKEITNFHKYIINKKGIEVGGPSKIFQEDNLLPIYNPNTYLDNINFNTNTIWEKNLKNEGDYNFPGSKKPGKQFVREASDLINIKDNYYDYLITSHFLEHTSNPLKCLKQFNRILKPGGLIIIVVPYKSFTFDRKREFTNFEHLLDDLNNNTQEDDMTHLEEILEKHDLIIDYNSGVFIDFKNRCLENNLNRGMHQHVFNKENLEKSLEYCGFKLNSSGIIPPYHLYAIATKTN